MLELIISAVQIEFDDKGWIIMQNKNESLYYAFVEFRKKTREEMAMERQALWVEYRKQYTSSAKNELSDAKINEIEYQLNRYCWL